MIGKGEFFDPITEIKKLVESELNITDFATEGAKIAEKTIGLYNKKDNKIDEIKGR